MAERKTILVTGATGAQGGGVARCLLADSKFAVRAFTRTPDSEKATALRDAGAEVVQGDLDDRESVRRAVQGVYGVFGVTNFWEHFNKEREQGINLVDAVAEAGVEHFVFSTLPSVKKISAGRLDVPHFDIKAELEEYARERIPGATYVHVAFYYDNFLAFFPPKKQEDGTYAFGFPQGDTPLAGVAADDVGGVVNAVFNRRDEMRDEVVFIAGDDLPAAQYAEILSRVTGKTVRYNHIPRETFAAFGFPGADDLANMFEFYRVHVPTRQAEIERSRSLYPQMQRFEPWAQEHREKLIAAMGD